LVYSQLLALPCSVQTAHFRARLDQSSMSMARAKRTDDDHRSRASDPLFNYPRAVAGPEPLHGSHDLGTRERRYQLLDRAPSFACWAPLG
jgi:hypothetical protein